MTAATIGQRRVVLLETDERSGLVAAVADAFAKRELSLDIATGPANVLLTFTAIEAEIDPLRVALLAIPGVESFHIYKVASPA